MERGTKYCFVVFLSPLRLKLKPGPDYLKSIDARSVGTIKRIAIWWLVLSILGLLIGFLAAAGAFR